MVKCKISLENIKKIRKERHLTQTGLGMRAGIDQGEISRLENNKAKGSLSEIESIADALHVCPFDLMTCDNCENGDCKGVCNHECVNCRRRKKKLE